MKEFGIPHPEAQYRKSVGAVIFNPKTNKVLGLDWKIVTVYGIVQGGQDEGESEEETLRREIIEETGYTDFEIVEKLGENTISYFYVDVKKVWRKLERATYLVILNSETQQNQQLEEVEKFELKWLPIDEFIEMAESHEPTESENFEDIAEVLRRARELI